MDRFRQVSRYGKLLTTRHNRPERHPERKTSLRRPRIAVGLFAVALVVVFGAALVFDRGRSPDNTGKQPPPTCAIDPADGEVAITEAIADCPNGSIVLFPANRQYHQAHRILVAHRQNLTIDGNGSTFTNSSNGTVTKAVDGNWVILGGHNITLKNFTAIGDFTGYEGQPRDLATIGTDDPEFTEAQMGIGLYGSDTVHVHDVTLLNHWGDGVTTGPDQYIDGSPPDYAKNIYLKRVTVRTVGRMCFGPTSGTNIWVEDSNCSNAWYGGLDAEIDNPDQPLQGLHVLRNTFDGYNHLGIFVPVAAANVPTRDIEIRDNTFVTAPDKKCAAPIHVGAYPDSNPAMFHNVVVSGNNVKHFGSGIVLDHVDGGSIEGNALARVSVEGSTPEGVCGVGFYDPIRVTNSVGVAIGRNGSQ